MKLTKFDFSLIIAMFITLLITSTSVNSWNQTADKLIRFHVLANSDEIYDQELKLEIKSEVFEYITELTKNEISKESANDIINQNIENINDLAQKIVLDNGYDYIVSTAFENEYYPQKSYDDFVLPSGFYNGLKIYIGNAKGQNWWCVLYPPLCSSTAFDTKDLTTEELDLITQKDYEFRFKFIDTYSNIVSKLIS